MVDDIKFNMLIDGGKKNFYIIDVFNKDNKNYILYKEENVEEIYAALGEIKDNDIKIIPIESDIDYDIVDEYLSGL